jgi:hypothetical protein
MPNPARLLTPAALLLGLAACTGNVRKPAPETVERVISVPTKVYVPIDPKYTKRAPIAEGPLRQAPQVARDRKRALEICYGQLETIEQIQGTPVPDRHAP